MRRGHDEWAHEYFIRGRFDLVRQITRRTGNDANKSSALNHQNASLAGLFHTAVAPAESQVRQRLTCNTDSSSQVNLSGGGKAEYSEVSSQTKRTLHGRNEANATSTASNNHDESSASSGHYLVRSHPGYRLCFVPNSYLANLFVSGREATTSLPPDDGQQQRGGENKAGPVTPYRTSAATVSPKLNDIDDRRNWSYDQWAQLGKS